MSPIGAEVLGQRKCSSRDKSNTTLFTLFIPPIITEKTELCKECLNIVFDDERREKLG